MQKVRRAYFDLCDPAEARVFAVELHNRGFVIIAADNTADELDKHPVFKARNNQVSRLRTFATGRVIEGISDSPAFVDIVCANLTHSHLKNHNDLGAKVASEIRAETVGVLMRAVGNYPLVLAVTDQIQFGRVLQQLDTIAGLSLQFRCDMAHSAAQHLRLHSTWLERNFQLLSSMPKEPVLPC